MGAFVGDANNDSLDLGFYRRARESVSMSVLGKGSLCYVQALVLMGNYLQKRNKPNAGFALIGIAWSMALSIGLHREFGDSSTSPFTMELRRRTWWVLFVFVSGAQLTFGRPPVSLVGVNTRPPTNLEDSNVIVDMERMPQARNGPTITSCLIAQIRLAIIANAVQTELLSDGSPDFSHAQGLDGQITAWLTSLPHYLQASSQLPLRLENPKHVLLWRCYHLRIILFRPFLFVALAKTTNFSTEDQGVQTCISTADTCVDSIHAFLGSHPHCKRGFAWYATYWLLSACFVHATCLAYRPRDAAALGWKFRLDKALEALRVLAPAQGVAVRAQKLLANLVGECTLIRYARFKSFHLPSPLHFIFGVRIADRILQIATIALSPETRLGSLGRQIWDTISSHFRQCRVSKPAPVHLFMVIAKSMSRRLRWLDLLLSSHGFGLKMSTLAFSILATTWCDTTQMQFFRIQHGSKGLRV